MNPQDISHDIENFIAGAPCCAGFTALVLISTIGFVLKALISGELPKAVIFTLLFGGEVALLAWADIGYLTTWLLTNTYYPVGYIILLLFIEVSLFELAQVRRRLPPP
jgi:hypothetical protein